MLKNYHKIKNSSINAIDGHLGKLDDFLFDDQSWAIRYMVVQIGAFMTKEKKLLSPAALISLGPLGFNVNISTDQIRNSPDINTAKPISRQKEEELHSYYNWGYYWNYPMYTNVFGSPLYTGFGTYPHPNALHSDKEIAERQSRMHERAIESEKTHLRSANEVINYSVVARGVEIGTLNDLLLENEHWAFRYSIIDTGKFLPGRKIPLASHWAERIEWEMQSIYFDIDSTIIENGPQYDNGMLINRDFETRLYDYYRKPYYWKN